MYAVLLVDDEPGHLIGLSKLLRRLRPDYTVFTAKNGKEALALCEANDFHLIITDIQMPIMDGLHFIEQLPAANEPRRIVYLTGYDYFEYAQRAIRLGTFEYVLKPVDIDKFIIVLEKAEKSLQEEQARLKEQSLMAAKLEAVVPVYRNRILTDWMLDKPLSPDAWAEVEETTGALKESCLIACELYGVDGLQEWEKDTLRARMKQWLSEHAGGEGSFSFVLNDDRHLVVTVTSIEPDIQQLETAVRSFNGLLQGGTARIGVSRRSSRIVKDAPALFRQAATACEAGFYAEDRRVFLYGAMNFDEAHSLAVDPRDEAALTEALHKDTELAEAVDAVIDRHVGKPFYARPADLTEWMVRLLCKIADAAEFLGPDTRTKLTADITATAVPPLLRELRQTAAGRLADIASAIAEARKGHKENVIHDCLAYIDEHYMDDLSLESVAAVFHFNASYFSQYFKSKLNINFSQYLTQVRLTKAKDLLEQCDDRVYQVAERLGYHDVKYFNRVFKKEFGLTPEEYRSIARRMKQAQS